MGDLVGEKGDVSGAEAVAEAEAEAVAAAAAAAATGSSSRKVAEPLRPVVAIWRCG